MNYTHLTEEERYHIYALKRIGLSQTRIAIELGRCPSTIGRELVRNKGGKGWRPKQAQEKSAARRGSCRNGRKFGDEHWRAVDDLLVQNFSPEQAAGRILAETAISISHETIYTHIYTDKKAGGSLHATLRCQKKRKKRYGSGRELRGCLKNRVDIDLRPGIVDEKVRIGDWEGDTVVGKSNKGAIVTLTERVSKFELAAIVPSKHAGGVACAVEKMLGPYADRCHTITFDNGKEFAEHERIAKALGADVFFAHPYHSWERGLNENTNGLLRQYFTKGSSFANIEQQQVQRAVDQMNHRPRKSLGWKSPHEVFFGVEMTYVKTPPSVALRI